MKPHLHKKLSLSLEDIIEINLDNSAQVFLVDSENYDNYLSDLDFDYYGTTVDKSPFRMVPPYEGFWHLIIEQVDISQPVQAHIKVISK